MGTEVERATATRSVARVDEGRDEVLERVDSVAQGDELVIESKGLASVEGEESTICEMLRSRSIELSVVGRGETRRNRMQKKKKDGEED